MTFKTVSRKLYLQYYRYKDSPYFSLSLYLLVLLISVALFFYVIIPQATNWFSVRQEIDSTRERINVINDNIAYLQSINGTELEDDFMTVKTAFPPDRDVSGLIAAINYAALSTGVQLEDFTFQGGEISSRSTASRGKNPEDTAQVMFTAKGSPLQIAQVLTKLQQTIPLLAIESVDARFDETNQSSIIVSYYFKSFPLITQADDTKIKGITPQNRELLQQLKSWEVPSTEYTPDFSSSSSADPL